MNTKQRAAEIVRLLEQAYPDAECALRAGKPYELMIAARLSAQCTDARVNQITPALFEKFPTVQAFADAEVEQIEQMIFTCGLYKTKAKSIKEMCRALVDRFGGELPDTMEDLLTLPGIGRKTANLLLGDIFGKPAIVVDTHCIRLSNRLGLASGKDPVVIENTLRKLIAPEKSSAFCHRLVLHGRTVCTARKPDCAVCPLKQFCPSNAAVS